MCTGISDVPDQNFVFFHSCYFSSLNRETRNLFEMKMIGYKRQFGLLSYSDVPSQPWGQTMARKTPKC